MTNNNITIEESKEAAEAFKFTLKNKIFKTDPNEYRFEEDTDNQDHFVGNWMYMGKDDETYHFKLRETRNYLRVYRLED